MLAGPRSSVPLEKVISVPGRALAADPLRAFLYSQPPQQFLPKGSCAHLPRRQLQSLPQKKSPVVIGPSDEVRLMDFCFAFLAPDCAPDC